MPANPTTVTEAAATRLAGWEHWRCRKGHALFGHNAWLGAAKCPEGCGRMEYVPASAALMAERARFLGKTKIEKQPGVLARLGSCRVFVGAKTEKGYGVIGIAGKTWKAHRYAWALFRGPIPKGKCALHECDIPACTLEEHLFLGTKAENNADMHAKGRGRGGLNSAGGPSRPPQSKSKARRQPSRATGSRNYERGEGHHHARITAADVVSIRAEFDSGRGVSEIARDRRLGAPHVHKIVNRALWKHV